MYSSTISIDTNCWGGVIVIPAQNQEFDSILKLSSRVFSNAFMRVVGEKPGIEEVLHQDVLISRLSRGILDFAVLTANDYACEFEFHVGPISEGIVLRNYQYAIDLRVELDVPVLPHIVSLDYKKLQF